MGRGNGSITCQCSHLSSFAILMAHYDVEVSRRGHPQKPTVAWLAQAGQAAGFSGMVQEVPHGCTDQMQPLAWDP